MTETIKSLDYSEVITALLRDVQTLHSNVFSLTDLRYTLDKVKRRIRQEGVGFLTKSLPRLGKALDKALSCCEPLDAVKLGFKPQPNSKLPQLFGELFRQVLDNDGNVLPNACVTSVKSLRQLCYMFYKLELPYDPQLERDVIDRFKKTEDEICDYSQRFHLAVDLIAKDGIKAYAGITPGWASRTVRKARILLWKVLHSFDEQDIFPKHGPGAVSTGERLSGKYKWTNVPDRITDQYPLDEYFYASGGHVCDAMSEIVGMGGNEDFAKVVLVPKDSRGPRLISCEPLANQWIQQGISRALVAHVEKHRLTRDNVRFTDQQPNRFAALQGSFNGKYATLDLNEASDRVTLGLVRLLFPGRLYGALCATRSCGTILPNDEIVRFHKFAPMGSALCFPILALTVWALLRAGLEVLSANVWDEQFDPADVYVYGDDVIVPAIWAEHAMTILESFGLKINRDKSCTKGFFRESCGMDAFKGHCVTPVRIRTLWSSRRCPESYVSWIAYANSCHERRYLCCRDLITSRLMAIYGQIPDRSQVGLSAPSLLYVPTPCKLPIRWNLDLQKPEFLVWVVQPIKVRRVIDGWSMLLRFFSEGCSADEQRRNSNRPVNTGAEASCNEREAFRVCEYTWRKRSKLRMCWR